jgi:hypothetical protein
MKVSEVIKRTSNSDIIDSLADTKMIATEVYVFYDKVLTFTNNYTELPTELPLSKHHAFTELKEEFFQLRSSIQSLFPTTSVVYRMVDEMHQYFKWY